MNLKVSGEDWLNRVVVNEEKEKKSSVDMIPAKGMFSPRFWVTQV